MNRFSKTQIYLHWITLLFVAITYAAMELRGWFPKGSSTYLLMRETHYNAGIFVWVLMFSRLIIKHRYSDRFYCATATCTANESGFANAHHALYNLPCASSAGDCFNGLQWKIVEFPWFQCVSLCCPKQRN